MEEGKERDNGTKRWIEEGMVKGRKIVILLAHDLNFGLLE